MLILFRLIKKLLQLIGLAFYIIPTLIIWYKGVKIEYLLFLLICWFIGMFIFFITFGITTHRHKKQDDEFDI